MLSPWDLPESVFVNGHEYAIRTDYRVVLDLLTALSDPDMQGETEAETALIRAELTQKIMFVDEILEADLEGCLQAIVEFVDMDLTEDENKKAPRLMDWEQDANLIIPAVNKVLGREIRAERMHWWTFLSAYMEIGECSFSHILSIRQKRAKGKKLEKWEQEYVAENKNVVLLREKMTDEDKIRQAEERKALESLF